MVCSLGYPLSLHTERGLTVATALIISLASLGVGYYIGSQYVRSPGLPVEPETVAEVVEEEEDESDDEGDIADGDLSAVKAGFTEPCKLVLVVRTDLKMSSGKIAAQHATLACYKALVKKNPKLVKHWERIGQAKIALKGSSEEQLMELEAVAKSLNLCARAIHDAGHTQVEAGTRTVLGIGPAPVSVINEVTGNLRLL
ncbi:peptidyl-tRNA hydrolase PTH2-domain-containing protein [Cyathus striatus]|nr:peptidyl-tRNA hydrolase PTH2-domain-containing protein [Cyathus striatus]